MAVRNSKPGPRPKPRRKLDPAKAATEDAQRLKEAADALINTDPADPMFPRRVHDLRQAAGGVNNSIDALKEADLEARLKRVTESVASAFDADVAEIVRKYLRPRVQNWNSPQTEARAKAKALLKKLVAKAEEKAD